METPRARVVLERLGYRVLHRFDEWAECLVLGHGERWHGVGGSEEEAFESALRHAFPSFASREALEGLLDGAREPSEPPPPPLGLPPTTDPVSQVVAPEPEDEALASGLADLEAAIQGNREELALLTPRRQRLVILGWLARARALQEAGAGIPAIEEGVSRVIRSLRSQSNRFWPGTITAFQRDATPDSCRRELEPRPSLPIRSWEDVATWAEEELLRVEAEDAAKSRDDRGWADANQLHPPPGDPAMVFEALRREVEKVGGDIHGPQPRYLELPDPARLLAWVHRARWLRGAIPGESWGSMMGRLRYWAHMTPGASRAKDALDPAFQPPRSWARLVGSQEEEARATAELDGVLGSVPGPDPSPGELLGWLLRALPLTSRHQRTIVEASRHLRGDIERVTEDDLPASDRRLRRRLEKWKAAFDRYEEGAPTPEPREDPGSFAIDLEEARPPIEEAVPDFLLEETGGKTVLFVSNRNDVLLRERLRERFRFGEVDWVESSPLRVAHAVESIGARRYDMVLGATGFLNHSVDGLLSRACRAAGIPYLRVNRGRPSAVQLALSHGFARPDAREKASA